MKNILEKNKTMWVLSIAVALLLWMYVISDQNPPTSDNINGIPVEFINQESLEEKGLVISHIEDQFVDIRVFGRRTQLYRINRDAIRVEADLSRLNTKGTHFLPYVIYGIPDDVEISRKNPEAIELTLDQIITQERDVKINIIGKPAQGMAALSYIVNPSKVTLEGAETLLDTVRDVVATIDITNAREEINQTLSLKAIDKEGNEVEGVTITPKTVDVTIPIGATKTIGVSPKITGGVPEGYVITKIEANPSEIRIGATSSQINDISSISTETISVDGQRASFEKKVRLILPEGVEVINSEAAVLVKITIEPYTTREIQQSTFDVINLGNDFIVQENRVEEPIKIILKGLKKDLDNLEVERLIPYVDATGLQEGQHQLPLNLDLQEGILLEAIEPKKVTVHIVRKDG